MKKIFILTVLALSCGLVWAMGTADAASGACSGHGGVNCGAGPDADGSVICNDGWRDSSVAYSSTAGCSDSGTPDSAAACPSMSHYDSTLGLCTCDTGYTLDTDAAGEQACVPGDTVCRRLYGEMSGFNSANRTCECVAGYVLHDGRCVTKRERCVALYGEEANYVAAHDTCGCNYGYTPDGLRCAPNPDSYFVGYPLNGTCPQHAALSSDGKCYCRIGYMSEAGERCIQTIASDKGLQNSGASVCPAELIRGISLSSVYYCGPDGKRYVFPNEKTYFTWYQDFSKVMFISDEELAGIPIGGNVTYRPGSRLVKIVSDPRVYAVEPGGVLRWVTSEAVAAALFGTNWNRQVDDIPDAFYVNYGTGPNLTEADIQ